MQTSQSVKVSVPMMGEIDIQKTSFRHQRVGDMLLLVEQTSEMSDNPMMGGMGGSVTATVSQLMVNGQAVDVAAAPQRADAGHDGDGDGDGHEDDGDAEGDGHDGHDHDG